MERSAKRRAMLWSGVGAAVVAGIVLAFRPQPVPVDLAEAARGMFIVTVDEEGKTRVRDPYVVSTPVAGRVRRIVLEAGDPVVAEQTVVAEIEPSDPDFLDERTRAEAQAELGVSDAARAFAAAQLEEALVELEFAETELDRARRLTTGRAISEQAVDEAQRAAKTQRASVASARAGLRVREHELVRARARLTSPVATHARDGACECVVVIAPVTGRVLRVLRESEGVVQTGEPLIELGDPTDLEIVVEMLSTEAVRVEPEQRVILEGWGGEASLVGRVSQVEPYGFTKVSALGIEEQRVNVIVELTSDPALWRSLGHGFRVDARVVVWEGDGVVSIPVTALFRHEAGWAVFVEVAGAARLRVVEPNHRAGLHTEIVEGVRAGERVVVSPSDRIEDGVSIVARN